MIIGTGGTLLLIGLSPTVQVDILHHADAVFPLRNPAIVTMPLAFAAAVGTSLLSRDAAESSAFVAMEHKALLGD
jgi:cation/acetate symporter